MKKIFIILAFAMAALFSTATHAADEALYDPIAPEGSAFVRYINADKNATNIKPSINGKTFKEAAFKSASPYYPYPEGKVALGSGKEKIIENISAGNFYTLVFNNNRSMFIQDKALKFRAKSFLLFYNFTTHKHITLKLADKDINIIDGVKSGASGFREINPVALTITAYDEKNREIKKLSPLSLERGKAYTILAFEEDKGKITFDVLENKIDTTQ